MQSPDDVFISGAGKKVFQRGSIDSPWVQQPINTAIDPFFDVDAITGFHRITSTTFVAVLGSLFELQEFVLRSTDGGSSWQIAHFGPDLTGFNDLEYLQNDRCIAVGDGGRIVLGTDSGANWTAVALSTQANLRSIAMWDPSNGFVAGDGILLRTTDSGSTWTPVYQGQVHFIRIAALNPDTLFATARLGSDSSAPRTFMRSFDGGANWTSLATPFVVDHGISVLPEGTIHVGTSQGLQRSTNNGESWFGYAQPTNQSMIMDIDFHDPQNGVAVGLNGVIHATSNGGGPGLPTAFFTNDTSIVCAGGSISFQNRSPVGFNYEWRINNSPVSVETDAVLTFNLPGTHTVTLVVSGGSEEVSYSRPVSVLPPPTVPPFSILLGAGGVCQGGNRMIQATPVYTSVQGRIKVNNSWVTDWSSTQPFVYQITNIQQDLPLEIQLRVNGECGPTFSTAFDTLRMIPYVPPLTLSVNSDSICFGDTARVILGDLLQEHSYRANWINPFGNTIASSIISNTAGSVVVEHRFQASMPYPSLTFSVISIQLGCTTAVTTPIHVSAFPVEAEFTVDPPHAIAGEPVSLQNTSVGNQFNWTFPLLAQPPSSSLPELQLTLQQTGFEEHILLVATNEAGCTHSTSIPIEVMVAAQPLELATCLDQSIGEPMPWLTLPTSMGLGRNYTPMDMVEDPFGNLIITGSYRNDYGNYYANALFITKYDRSGQVIWDHRMPVLSNHRATSGLALDVDASGNILLAGHARAFSSFPITFLGLELGDFSTGAGFVIKLDPNGQALWRIKISGNENYLSVPDVLFLPDGGAIFTMNGSQSARVITFANGVSLSTAAIESNSIARNLFLVKVDQGGARVAVLPGSKIAAIYSHYSVGPTFSPLVTDNISTGYVPLSPRLSRSCDGSIQVWSLQSGKHVLQGQVYGVPNQRYYALSSTDDDLSHWLRHDLFATEVCSEGKDILTRPVMLSGSRKGTTLLGVSSRQVVSQECDTTIVLSNGTALDANGQSVVFLLDNTTGEVLWERKLGGVGIKEIVAVENDRFMIFGQALERASLMIDGIVLGFNDLQLRDIVLLEFDFEGNFYGLNRSGSIFEDIACEATSNGCGEISMLLSKDNEARLLRSARPGACSMQLCNSFQLRACIEAQHSCAGDPIVLSWQTTGDPGALRIIRTNNQGSDAVDLGTVLDASIGHFSWTPDPQMYNGETVDLHVIDQFNDTLGSSTVTLLAPIEAGLVASTTQACRPDSIALTVPSGFSTHLWSHTPSDTSLVYVHTNATYSVTVYDQFGCAANGSVSVSFLPGDLFASTDTIICGVQVGSLHLPAGFDQYTWSTGSTGQTNQIPVNESGTYFASAISSACSLFDTIQVQFIPPIQIIVPEQPFCIGGLLHVTIEPDIPVTYSWAIGGSAPTHIILPNLEVYNLIVTDQGGCTHSTSIHITPVSCTGIHETAEETTLLLHPNPASTAIQIIHPRSVFQLNVLDASGRSVNSQLVPLGSEKTLMDLGALAPGYYLMEAITYDGTRILRHFLKS